MKQLRLATSVVLTMASSLSSADAGQAYVGLKSGLYSFDNLDSKDHLDDSFSDYAWGGYLGYRFTFPMAIEAEYLKLAEDNVLFGTDFQGNVFSASLKPTWDLGEHFELYAKLGWAWWDAELQAGWDKPLAEKSLSWNDGLIGFGAAVKYAGFHLRLEHQMSELRTHLFEDVDSELLTLGIGYRF
ncbi:MAG: porin family protein [Pseudomonadota bacterium]